jgi:hypothetical protein
LIIIGGLSYAIYEYTPLHCIFSPLQCAEDTASGLQLQLYKVIPSISITA